MLEVVLKDGSIKQIEKKTKVIDFIKSFSTSLAKNAICCKLNGKLSDLQDEITENTTLEIITSNDKEAIDVLNHSCAHLLAHAVSRLYKDSMFAIGPTIEEGFYYDMNISAPVKLEDLPLIEKEMKKIVASGLEITKDIITKQEAKELFKTQKYKLEIIDGIESEYVSIYKQGDFIDLCSGPHVLNTSKIKAFKLLNVAGAYWRGDSNNEMLTRIYGIAFFNDNDLQDYINIVNERKERDHRKIGKELELFMTSDYGPGFPFFLPNGMALKNALIAYWQDVHIKHDYKFIQTPTMLNKELWEISGHWFNYKENMYTSVIDDKEFAIKPMNCPGGILVYKNKAHSYKEFPLRLAELGTVHRHEASGALSGLFRVRTFTQDDAHIFMTEEEITDEISNIIKLYKEVYDAFNLSFHIELSTRPLEKYIGDISVWDKSEEALKQACIKAGFSYIINEGDGAFYGPKLDFKLKDSMNRIWQCGTIQLDMNLPERFDIYYISKNQEKKRPIMVHRALFGSIERFIGIITEHFKGSFPLFIAPIQVRIIPVNEIHKKYCNLLKKTLVDENIRVDLDYKDEKLGYKIREAQTFKIPYTLVIGDNEVKDFTVTYRKRHSQEQVTVHINEFIKLIKQEVKNLK